MNTCHEIQSLLDDYVDGYLPVKSERHVRIHLASCDQCRREEDSLQALIARARNLPPEIEPGRDLWPEVRERIAGKPRRVSLWQTVLPGMLAAAAIALVAGLWFTTERPVNSPPQQAPVAQMQPNSAQAEYSAAKAELLVALHERESELSPEIIEIVETNLRIIESAVEEIHVALLDSPGNPHLERVLMAAYKNEIELLQRTVLLANAS